MSESEGVDCEIFCKLWELAGWGLVDADSGVGVGDVICTLGFVIWGDDEGEGDGEAVGSGLCD